mmetsp:Transcript_90/g.196  ORF Transcript_90/g.196 Transcript_90/m.196 type:complete len:84 (+) Transcript_90:784-1035(+)
MRFRNQKSETENMKGMGERGENETESESEIEGGIESEIESGIESGALQRRCQVQRFEMIRSETIESMYADDLLAVGVPTDRSG